MAKEAVPPRASASAWGSPAATSAMLASISGRQKPTPLGLRGGDGARGSFVPSSPASTRGCSCLTWQASC